MSKLLEALKAGVANPTKAKKSEYELTQEQLADIYFSGSEKVKKSDYPLVIKVIEKPKAGSVVPWIISSAAVFLMALSLFTTKRVFVDIKVIDERNPYLQSMPSEKETPQKQNNAPQNGNKINAEDFVFEGASKLKSSSDKSNLTLINSSIASFARANLYFNTPLNLSGSKIVFYAKGQKGGENLAFALKDRGNVAAFEKGRMFPFPNNLTTDWQMAEILLDSSIKEFDEKKVASLRFEFGTKETKNKPGDTIFIKDLQIVPA